jgi:hypothetical protein
LLEKGCAVLKFGVWRLLFEVWSAAGIARCSYIVRTTRGRCAGPNAKIPNAKLHRRHWKIWERSAAVEKKKGAPVRCAHFFIGCGAGQFT